MNIEKSFDIPVLKPLTKEASTGKEVMTVEEMINDNKPKYNYVRIKFQTDEAVKLFEDILKNNSVKFEVIDEH